MITPRNALARGGTFVRFAVQQLGARGRVERQINALAAKPFAIEGATLELAASDPDWKPTGVTVARGQRFAISSRGAIWLSKPLGVVMEPRVTVWVRIGGQAPVIKPADADCVLAAWADGEVEVFAKAFSEWASEAGDLLSPERPAMPGKIAVRVALTDRAADTTGAPEGWSYLWRLGDGRVYHPGDDGEITVSTHGDVGILQTETAYEITPRTRMAWSWKVDALPSRLPEDIQTTHDYLSVAVEFDNGRDLTFMWSAGLPHDHVFHCPLPFWCDRETHWVVRGAHDKLGQWCDEERSLQADLTHVYGDAPGKAVRLWLIANSIFQRIEGRASVRNLRLFEAD